MESLWIGREESTSSIRKKSLQKDWEGRADEIGRKAVE